MFNISVTPLDYEPPGFKSTPAEEGFQFKQEPVNIKVGDVATVSLVSAFVSRTQSQFVLCVVFTFLFSLRHTFSFFRHSTGESLQLVFSPYFFSK